MSGLFELASRFKLRFNSNKGQLTVEDLWDLSLTSINNIAMVVNKELKDASQESFIVTKSKDTHLLELRLEILKYIIKTKQEESEEAKTKSVQAAHKQMLLELKANKQMQALQSLSLEDIDKQLAELG